jgi:hypothetical protein
MTDLEDDLDELRSDYEDWDEKVFDSDEDGPSLEEEIEILKDLRARALAITRNAKGDRLASACRKVLWRSRSWVPHERLSSSQRAGEPSAISTMFWRTRSPRLRSALQRSE